LLQRGGDMVSLYLEFLRAVPVLPKHDHEPGSRGWVPQSGAELRSRGRPLQQSVSATTMTTASLDFFVYPSLALFDVARFDPIPFPFQVQVEFSRGGVFVSEARQPGNTPRSDSSWRRHTEDGERMCVRMGFCVNVDSHTGLVELVRGPTVSLIISERSTCLRGSSKPLAHGLKGCSTWE
jgi:hypothetical protein